MPGQKSALDLVTEAYNAVWTDEERARQQEQQDGRTAFLANRAGAYVANTVVSVKTHAPTSPTRSRPNTREAAKAVSGAVTGPGRNARKDVYAQFGARARALLGLEESDGNDEVVDDDAPWNAAEHDLQSDNSDRDQAEFEEHRDKPADFESSSNDAESSPTAVETDTGVAVDAETPDEQAENDARDSVPESGSRCSTASAGSRDGSPSTARVFGGAEQTDSEKLQQLNEKAEEIDRISRMIADKIQTKLSGPSSNARGKQRESHIGPRARDLLQRTSPRRKNAKKTKARGKHGQIDRRFKGNPLARKQSASKSKTKLRPLRTRAKRPKSKLWEPKQGHHARSNSEDGAGAFARTSEAAPLPFPTSTSVIARGPSRKSRREVIDSVRDGKRRLKQKQQARKPWNRMEADALALIEQKKLEAQQKKQAKRRAAEIAQERLKTISVGQWLQTVRMDRFYEAFLDEGYSTVHELLQLTEGEFHMLLKEVGIRKMKKRSELHRKLRAFLRAVLESSASAATRRPSALPDINARNSAGEHAATESGGDGDDSSDRDSAGGSGEYDPHDDKLPDIRASSAMTSSVA